MRHIYLFIYFIQTNLRSVDVSSSRLGRILGLAFFGWENFVTISISLVVMLSCLLPLDLTLVGHISGNHLFLLHFLV